MGGVRARALFATARAGVCLCAHACGRAGVRASVRACVARLRTSPRTSFPMRLKRARPHRARTRPGRHAPFPPRQGKKSWGGGVEVAGDVGGEVVEEVVGESGNGGGHCAVRACVG